MSYLKNEIHRKNAGWEMVVLELPDGKKIVMKIRRSSRTQIKFQWEIPKGVRFENRNEVRKTRFGWESVVIVLPDDREVLMSVRRSSAVRIQLGWNAPKDIRIHREAPPSQVRTENQPRHPALRIF